MSFHAILVELLEVLGAEVLVRLPAFEQFPADAQLAVGDRHGGPFDAASGGDPAVLGGEVTVLLAAGRPGALVERGLEPAVALSQPAAASLAGALVVAGAEAGPRGQVRAGGEAGHVGPDLRQHVLGGAAVDAGDLI